jgi:ATP-binding cassette subfamily B (MDR/TAP) protein 1
MAFGTVLGAKFKHAIHAQTGESAKEANLLAGDAIINYRTVASFANEEGIIDKYEEMLVQNLEQTYTENHKAGLAFGFSQFSMMFIFAALFYSGAKIQDHYKSKGEPLQPEDVFIAIFSMMFGAQQAGNSQLYGPDIGKASSAAKKIFRLVDEPSQIDAVKINGEKDKVRIGRPAQQEIRGERESQ